ncbi:MAG: hypothetical protein M1457_09505 [bacterium]|nr:hypothetical protein [bacterium]
MVTTKEISRKMIEHLAERRDSGAPHKELPDAAQPTIQPHMTHFFRIATYRKRQILERMLMD